MVVKYAMIQLVSCIVGPTAISPHFQALSHCAIRISMDSHGVTWPLKETKGLALHFRPCAEA
jgi:hypothetical protein